MKQPLKETLKKIGGGHLLNEVSSKLMKTVKQTIDRESAMDIEDLVMSLNIDNKYYSDIGRYLDNIRDEEQGMKPSGFAKDSKKQLLKILTKAVKTKKLFSRKKT